jgi:hypothetical protein
MSMMLDLIWLDSGAIEYRAACAQCSFRAGPFDDEDTALVRPRVRTDGKPRSRLADSCHIRVMPFRWQCGLVR